MGRLVLVPKAEVSARGKEPVGRSRRSGSRDRSRSRGRGRGGYDTDGDADSRGRSESRSQSCCRGRGRHDADRDADSRGRSEGSSWSERSWSERDWKGSRWKGGRWQKSWNGVRDDGKAGWRWDGESSWRAGSGHRKSEAAAWQRRVLFVGIAGPSGAGKTTLARQLVAELSSPFAPIGMDWFLEPKRMPKHPVFGKNWETPEGVDFDGLRGSLGHISEVLGSADRVPAEYIMGAGGERGSVVRKGQAGRALGGGPVVVILEGFLLFYDKALCDELSASIWIEADCETCLGRRHQRGKASRKRPTEESGAWFRGLVWATFQEHRKRQIANAGADALRLGATGSKEDLLSEATLYCKKMLSVGGQDWKP